jgi:hypothetical protein
MGILRFIFLLVGLAGLVSCQGFQKCNRSAKHIEKAVKLCPEIALTDTIRDTISVSIPAIQFDTVLVKADTISISRDRWNVRLITVRDSIYISGGCDSILVEVPIEVPCDQIQPIKKRPLAWWQITLMVCGGLFLLLVGYLIVRIVY